MTPRCTRLYGDSSRCEFFEGHQGKCGPWPFTNRQDAVSAAIGNTMNMPVWKCKTCGCLWRDNLDETVSLLNTEQKSCLTCEHGSTREVCEIHWLRQDAVSATIDTINKRMSIPIENIDSLIAYGEQERESARVGKDREQYQFYSGWISALERVKNPAEHTKPNVRGIIEALGFDPTNHHNATKCPYCTPGSTLQQIEALEKAARIIFDAFTKDEAQGYRSKDRQYVIDILGPVLEK